MPDDLHGRHPRPATEELGGPLRRAVEQVRGEPVTAEEIARCLRKSPANGRSVKTAGFPAPFPELLK